MGVQSSMGGMGVKVFWVSVEVSVSQIHTEPT